MLDSGVAPRIEMLTYWLVRSAFNPRGALLSSAIWYFETTFMLNLGGK